jgi:acyl-coenzyme A synthetase/AMP-(fatty) acid ligase
MLTDVIGKWARRQPAKPALIHNDVAMDYASFARAIEVVRRSLALEHLPVGRTAMVRMDDLRCAWIVVLALRALGLNTICVQSYAQAKAMCLRDAACFVVAQWEQTAADSDDPAHDGVRLVAVPAATLATVRSGDDLPPDGNDGRPAGGHMLHTSGSTAQRKIVLLDAASEDAANQYRAAVLACDYDSIHHGLKFGLWTGIGYKQSAAVWHVGGCVVLDQRPRRWKNFLSHGVNRARLLPSTLSELLKALDASQPPNDALEIGVGGASFPLELARATVARLTPNLTIPYGVTELCVTPLMSHFRAASDLHWLAPVPGRLVQVVDDEGRECPPGQEGALRIRTTTLDCTSYVDDADATARAFRDGFFYPGDRAVARADRRIRILGRSDDVINVAGRKMATAPLEQALQRQLRVVEVCLFARPLDSGRQELAIAIETDRELLSGELDAVARKFRAFDRVRVSVLRQFPRTDTGTRKTRRTELKKLVFAEPAPSG